MWSTRGVEAEFMEILWHLLSSHIYIYIFQICLSHASFNNDKSTLGIIMLYCGAGLSTSLLWVAFSHYIHLATLGMVPLA